jgi:serine phosphatase RsbU (regulator of sigma subunit)/PAS domain-containing protein
MSFVLGKQGLRWVVVAGIALSAAIALLDALIGERIVLVALLGLPPLAAAALVGPRPTSIVAATSILLALALGAADHDFGSAAHVVRVLVVFGGSTLAVWISELRERAVRARRRLEFLAEATAQLDTSLDYETVVRTLTRVAVPEIADWCSVYTLGPDGEIKQLALAHRDPEKERFASEMERRYPLAAEMDIGVPKVIRTGEPEVLLDIAASDLEAYARDPEHLRLIQQIGLRSAITAPLRARSHTLGAFAVVMGESGRRFRTRDLELVRNLADRAALAIDNARLFTQVRETESELRKSAEEVEAILRGVASAITVHDRSGQIVFANEAAVRMLRMPSVEALMERDPGTIVERWDIYDEHGDPLPISELPGRIAQTGKKPPDKIVFFRDRITGESRWSTVKATPIYDEHGQVTLVVSIFDDITQQKREELGERLLSESSRMLSSSLDYETTLDNVAHLAVPGFADWCAVDLVDERGEIKQVALAHTDPSKLVMGADLSNRYPVDPDSPRGVPNVIRTGQAELYVEIPDELLVEAARDQRHLTLLREMGFRSAILAPMVVAGRAIGAMTFVSADWRRFDEQDFELAKELARRAAIAVQNSRLYAERTHIAQTLQRSLLPPLLPDIPGVEVAARFRPAGEGYEVGGDFYDVFNTGAGWGVVIGDVCGKGPEAAALTGLARHTVRAAAMQEHDPSRILILLSEAIRREHRDSQFCTAAYGHLELRPVGAALTIASGGHPLPLMMDEDGGVEQVGVSGALLGSFAHVDLTDQRLELQPGSALVLYTDGVIEAGNPRGAFGLEGLVSVLRSSAGLSANEIAERIDNAVVGLGKEPPDDVAVVVLRIRE